MSWTKREIYGPGRNADYKAIRDFNLRGSVLQTGDYNLLNNSWDSHYRSVLKDLFTRSHSGAKRDQNLIKQKHESLDHSHIFGKENGYSSYDPTSRDYGQNSWNHKPRKMNIDREIHIVDFSPKYNNGQNKDLSSMYKYSYNNASKLNQNRSSLAEMQARTKDVRTTHFDFGTSKERISTETTDSFKEVATDISSMQKSLVKDQYKSNIFKNGDWNVVQRSLAGKSVTADEFGTLKSAQGPNNLNYSFGKSATQSFQDQPDYVKTHINIQAGDKERSPFFRKDYLVGIGGAIHKPRIAKAPISSSVIPRDASPVKSSTNKEDYVSFQRQLKDLDRSSDFLKNKIRLAENHIKETRELRNISPKILSTVTTSNFLKPRSDALTLEHEKAPVSKYRYLDSDAALAIPRHAPLISEVKDSHRPYLLTKDNYTPGNDAQRHREDKKTHFVFGTDAQGRSTEHDTRFSQPSKLDPKVIAAGIKDIKTSAFAKMYKKSDHVKKENVEQLNKHNIITVMQDDYRPMETRRFTSPQERLINKLEKYPPNIVPSHLFHIDNTSPLVSRTKTDFTAPYKMKGNLAFPYNSF